MTMVQKSAVHQQFPALATKAYFNYGGQGPMSQSAIAAISAAHQHWQEIGPFGLAANQWIMQEAQLTRAAIAQSVGADPANMTLTEDVTVGCNIALWGFEWQAGDHILLTDCEHQGVIAAVQEISRRFGVTVSTCPIQATLNEGDPVMAIAQHLQPTTRLVVLSHLLWNTGQILPLADIIAACRQHSGQYTPVRILVDAAQSFGSLPLQLDELGIDFYAFTVHKWCCGPAGLGGLYINPAAREELHPTFIGWRSVTTSATGQPTGWHPDARRYEVATSDYTLYPAVREAIALHDQWGSASERLQRIQQISAQLWEQLQQLPKIQCLKTSPPDAGIISFQLQDGTPSRHKALVSELETHNILLRTLASPSCVRACVHYFTQDEECDRLIHALKTLM